MSEKKQYSDDKLREFKSIIDKELEIVENDIEKLEKDSDKQKEKRAHSNVDFNQSSKHFQQQAKNKEIINRLKQRRTDLHAALDRIESKTYGICNRTGELIREERLEASPTARYDILKA